MLDGETMRSRDYRQKICRWPVPPSADRPQTITPFLPRVTILRVPKQPLKSVVCEAWYQRQKDVGGEKHIFQFTVAYGKNPQNFSSLILYKVRKVDAHKIHFDNLLKKGTYSNEIRILKSQRPRKEISGMSYMAKLGC